MPAQRWQMLGVPVLIAAVLLRCRAGAKSSRDRRVRTGRQTPAIRNGKNDQRFA
jgi:hypothetical protein